MAASDTILGRVANRHAFNQRLKHNRKLTRNRWGFTVTAYTAFASKHVCYADHTENKPWTSKGVYRVIVYPKREAAYIDDLQPMT